VDTNGNAYVAGDTSSSNFPLVATSPAFYNGRTDGGFVSKFNPSGNQLVYSTYIGGAPSDQVNAVAADATGATYITGQTQSLDFPVQSAYQSTPPGFVDAFVAKLMDGMPVTATVTTSPAGLNVTVDGSTLPAPRFFAWAAGSQHTLSAPSPQGTGNTRQLFQSWSQGGALTQTVIAPSVSTTYTANFATQYLLITNVSPTGAGTITPNPSATDGFYGSGSSVQLTASAAAGYAFSGFSGDLSGTTNPQSVTMPAPRTVTAIFACAYSIASQSTNVSNNAGSGSVGVTAGSGCAVTVSSSADWLSIVSAPPSGSGTISFSFTANPTSNVRTGSLTVTGQGASLTYTVTQAGIPPASVTVATAPAGLLIQVDGQTYTAPRSFVFTPGTQHTIGVASPQSSGSTRGVFLNWSDGGAATHTIVAPATSITITANFASQFLLTRTIAPPGAGTLTASPASSDGFYDAGASVQLTAAPASGVVFAGWAGDLGGNANPQSIVMDAPKTVVANFTPLVCGTNYTLDNQNFVAEAIGGTFTVNITTDAGCFWSATISPAFQNPFITLNNVNGVGNGSVQFTVLPHTGQFPRTGSITVAGSVVQIDQRSPSPTVFFTDVGVTHPFFDYITNLRRFNITSGCSATEYCAEDPITRGQMAVFLMRYIFGSDNFEFVTTPYFTDVPATHPYFRFIQKMRELNVTTGCTATTYCPDASVTRGQMAVFLIRVSPALAAVNAGQYRTTPYFTDVPTTHPYFAFVQKMKELGITTGCTATTYCPDSPNTRGQMAVFIIRGLFTP
jgi:hypothetical protein